MPLQLGISPCPNDTYAFYGLLHGKTSFPLEIEPYFLDIQEANDALNLGRYDFLKVSFFAMIQQESPYGFIDSGAALGFGCGPLLVTTPDRPFHESSQATIAVPGLNTTAYLLFRLKFPQGFQILVQRFDQIMDAVVSHKADAGLIIHESRFTFAAHGLSQWLDLGQWWENRTNTPIPLGGIVASKVLDPSVVLAFQQALRESITYAEQHEEEVMAFMQQHAQELSPSVIRDHVRLYVNSFSKSLGPLGRQSVSTLFQAAQQAGLAPKKPTSPFFFPE
jgi:1,4-dihydroxy-6-naphthoate synthase